MKKEEGTGHWGIIKKKKKEDKIRQNNIWREVTKWKGNKTEILT
jgi:hypothetical protein